MADELVQLNTPAGPIYANQATADAIQRYMGSGSRQAVGAGTIGTIADAAGAVTNFFNASMIRAELEDAGDARRDLKTSREKLYKQLEKLPDGVALVAALRQVDDAQQRLDQAQNRALAEGIHQALINGAVDGGRVLGRMMGDGGGMGGGIDVGTGVAVAGGVALLMDFWGGRGGRRRRDNDDYFDTVPR